MTNTEDDAWKNPIIAGTEYPISNQLPQIMITTAPLTINNILQAYIYLADCAPEWYKDE